VGRQLSKQLNAAGITTVLQLAGLDAAMVRSRWGVVVERTVHELQGTSFIELEHALYEAPLCYHFRVDRTP
jgi:DNA polymerase V